ncbi:hypothetical protein GCM10027321_18270 [Massilia terrae]|uniref:DUF2486 family protein n=1 Tax=Massilia terrae TaxID=1811224 RepID=A0ABT2CWE4_9BURK|nr:hypothetical protein [Massilia terrae]MCS0658288.1 hypothetical protein [Massilia terrae]
MSQDAFDDSSIPVLTEVVRETAPAPATADAAVAEVVLPDAAETASTDSDSDRDRRSGAGARLPPESPTEATPAPDLEHRAATQLSDDDWAALELRLSERILQQLQGRVDFVLQQRLRDSMADVLQHALAGLTDEIRGGLAQTIEQIVTRAVAQELAHLKSVNH